jgi:hypothetical protein
MNSSSMPAPQQTAERHALARDPHLVLAAVAVVVLLCELAARESTSALPMVPAAAVALIGFVAAWREQDRLRLPILLGLSLAFQLAWIVLHLRVGLSSFDSEVLYRRWGNELLEGRYPEAQYPPGAVLLFAFEAWLGGGATRTSHAFAMIPFQLVTVAAIWAFRTRTTPWLAALVALWPLNAFFWEFRFDPVPAAFLAVGLLLAARERWGLSGAVLGLGAAAKWIPGVAFAILTVWLLASGRRREAGRHVLAFGAVFLLLHIPFFVWSTSEATYAYRYFSDQGLTGESVWYLLLAPLGFATVPEREFWLPADVPGWADPTVTLIQGLVLVAVAVAAVRVRGRLPSVVAIAAMAPVLFLLTNRVFSPQYLVPILAAWAAAGAVLPSSRREQLALGIAAMAATSANAFVYPYTLHGLGMWKAASGLLFAIGLATSVWLVIRALEGASPAPAVDRARALATAGGGEE